MKDKEENNKYESLASFLDGHTSSSEGNPLPMDDEESRKLMFLWDECQPEKAQTEGVWNKTLQKINADSSSRAIPRQRPVIRTWIWGVAASIALLMGFTYFFYQMGTGAEEDEALKMQQFMLSSTAPEDVKEVTLVVSDKKKIELANNSQVAYTTTGEVQVNSDQLKETTITEEVADNEVATEEEEFNQIIVPKGRRSMIILADNSKIWINSGSKVIYPRAFKGDKRQIFVEGEVYLKVARNEAKPFIVNTSSFEVEVLGTSFNVNAYKGNAKASVVLVEGAVNIKDSQEQSIKMSPNERVELNETGIAKKEEVNALEYIHWVDGVWILDGKPLKEVLQYLSEYYGQSLSCDPAIGEEPIYGKLFLNEDLDKVLESIQQTLSQSIASENIIIRQNSIQ